MAGRASIGDKNLKYRVEVRAECLAMKVSLNFRSAVSLSEINFLGHYALLPYFI